MLIIRLNLILFFLLLASATITAQIGINGGIKRMNTPSWEKYFEGEDFLKNGYKVGLDYWFRLKKKRIEFTPELNYSRFKSDIIQFAGDLNHEFSLTLVGLHVNTNIYPMDFGNDCNCPTFEKSGAVLEKGLFIQIIPGISWMQANYENPQNQQDVTQFIPSVGVGVGLDFGLSNFITLTPIIQYHLYFGAEWEGLDEIATDVRPIAEGAAEATDMHQFFAGFRLGFRFDELNKYGYR